MVSVPLQIVAGLEPENTNVFLQMLASACRQGPADDAVQVSDSTSRSVQVSPHGCGWTVG